MPNSDVLMTAVARVQDALFATSSRRITVAAMLARSTALQGALHASKLSCIAFVTNDASDVLTGLLIAERVGTSVMLVANQLSRHLPDLIEQAGAGAVIQAGDVVSFTGEPQHHNAEEILLITSGTTGTPKIVRHSWKSLLSRIHVPEQPSRRIWLLTYLPSGFAGLQVILTAALANELIVWADPATFPKALEIASEQAVTHVSCTPTFLRGFVAAGASEKSIPSIRQLTLGGEATDQPLLNLARATFPSARVCHIYATSEAGALFSVHDGKEGFPGTWIDDGIEGVHLKIENGTLRVMSPRAMLGYAGKNLCDGWVDTGDVVETRGDRVIFTGRADRRINVAGYKISPEEVERAILAVPGVMDVMVRAVRSPITGNVLAADIVPDAQAESRELRQRILSSVRSTLAPYQVPRLWHFVQELEISAAGKKLRTETQSNL